MRLVINTTCSVVAHSLSLRAPSAIGTFISSFVAHSAARFPFSTPRSNSVLNVLPWNCITHKACSLVVDIIMGISTPKKKKKKGYLPMFKCVWFQSASDCSGERLNQISVQTHNWYLAKTVRNILWPAAALTKKGNEVSLWSLWLWVADTTKNGNEGALVWHKSHKCA